ncbi:LamG-like jellyroll fold domain-containing protein [Patescibacteria group bacterium]
MRSKKQASRAYLSYYILAALVGLVFSCHLLYQTIDYLQAADGDSDGVDDTVDACYDSSAHTGLISYWGFEEGSGTTINDSYNNNNSGTLNGDPTWVPGQIGQSLDLDGTGDYILVPDDDSLSFTDGAGNDQPFSISLWTYIKGGTAAQPFIHKGNTTTNYEWIFQQGSDGDVSFYVVDPTAANYLGIKVSSSDSFRNRWVHFMATYDGSESNAGMKIYIDGVAQSITNSNTGTYVGMTNGGGTLKIGLKEGPTQYFNGFMDEVGIFNYALNATEVTNLFNSSFAGTGYCGIYPAITDTDSDGLKDEADACNNNSTNVPSGLVSYWGFDDNSGSTASDSYDTNPGTITGALWTSGQLSSALDFDGVDDHVLISDDDSLDNFSAMSVFFWAKPDASQTSELVAKHNVTLRDSIWELYQNDQNLSGRIAGDAVTCSSTDNSFTTGSWHFVGITWDGSTIKVYNDNNEVASCDRSVTMSNSGGNVVIGRYEDSTPPNYPFDGQIDDLAIFDRKLETSEITSMYNNGLNAIGYCEADTDSDTLIDEIDACLNTDAPTGLVSYWGFEEGVGTVAQDSYDSNPGTLTNGPVWSTGQVGGALTFDGVDDYVDINYDAAFNTSAPKTFSAWIKSTYDSPHTIYFVGDKSDSFDNTRIIIGSNVTGTIANELITVVMTKGPADEYIRGYATSNRNELLDGAWHHLAVAWTGSEVQIYLDGVSKAISGSYGSGVPGVYGGHSDADTVLLGAKNSSDTLSSFFNGAIDDTALFDRVLTETEIEGMYQNGLSSYGFCAALPGGEVSKWSFEEGSGTTTADSWDGNLATLSGGLEAGWNSDCISGNCLEFDGVNDYVSLGNPANLQITGALTISFWVKPDATDSFTGTVGLVDKGSYSKNYGGWGITGSGNKISFFLDSDIGGASSSGVSSSKDSWNTDQWYQVVGVFDGTGDPNNVSLYVDGFLDNQGTFNGSSTQGGSINLNIGARGGGGSYFFDGAIDEVQIYNKALDANEVLVSYHEDSPPGPLSKWDFNEESGQVLNDIWNLNDGTLDGSEAVESADPTWESTDCVIGSCLDFDGSDDYVSVSDDDSLSFGDGASDVPFTVSAWVNMDEATQFRIISKGNSIDDAEEFLLTVNNSEHLMLAIYDQTTAAVTYSESDAALSENEWIHVVATYDGSGSNSGIIVYVDGVAVPQTRSLIGSYTAMENLNGDLNIGRLPNHASAQADGKIDEVEIYDKELNATEINELYLEGYYELVGQVSQWKFEEGSGDAAADTWSDNDGTLSGGLDSTGWSSDCVAGNCLDLDGVDDRVSIGNPESLQITGPLSIAFWMQPDDTQAFSSRIGLVDKGSFTRQYGGWGIGGNSSNGLSFLLDPDISGASPSGVSSSKNTWNTGEWYYVVGVFDGTGDANNVKLYIDGALDNQGTFNGSSTQGGTCNLNIGARCGAGTYFFDGAIDEAEIYDRELSSLEISTAFNNNNPDNDSDGVQNNFDACHNPDAPTDLISYWGFEASAGTEAVDSFGNSDGTLTNMTGAEWTAGQVNQALTFDGVNDYIDLGSATPFNVGTDSMTLETWFKTSSDDRGRLISHGSAAWSSGFSLGVNNCGTGTVGGGFVGQGGESTGVSVCSRASHFNDNAWHHLVLVLDQDNSQVKLFVDGQQQKIMKQPAWPNTAGNIVNENVLDFTGVTVDVSNPAAINLASYVGGSEFFSGSLDEVAVYSTALTSDQVLSQYLNSNYNSLGYCDTTYVATCGDGIIDVGETCDDSDTSSSDGCSASCQTESSFACVDEPSVCSLDTDSDDLPNVYDACVDSSAPSDMVAYWGFNEGTGVKAYDSVDGHEGTLVDGPSWISGQVGEALDFVGTGDYVDTGFNPVDYVFNDFSAVGWVYVDSATNTGNQRALSIDDVTLAGNVGAREVVSLNPTANACGNGRPIFGVSGAAGGSNVCAIDALSTGWHHLAGTREGSVLKLYIDGVEVNENPSAIIDEISPEAPLVFGRVNASYGGEYFKGAIDEAALFSRALTPIEIQTMHTSGLSGNGYCAADIDSDGLDNAVDACNNNEAPSGLISYWGFEEGFDSTANDSFGSYDGVLSGSPAWALSRFGQVISFDGIDDYVSVADHGVTLSGGYTFTAWIKRASMGTWDIVWTSRRGGDLTPWSYAGVATDKFKASVHDGSNRADPISTTIINDDQWYHVASTWDGASKTLSVYVNGVLEDSATNLNVGSIDHASADFRIGDDWSGSNNEFDGLIDEAAIFNRPLNLIEIKTIYNNGLVNSGACVGTITHEPDVNLDVTATAGSTAAIDGGTGDITIKDVQDNPILILPSGATGTTTVTKTTTTAGGGLTYVSGATLPGGETKTVYVDKNLELGGVCVNDTAGATSVSENCSGTEETILECPGTEGDYECVDTGSKYQVTGLTHSAVGESTPPSLGGVKFHIENAIRNPHFWINEGAESTSSRQVTLTFEVEKAKEMIISNSPDFVGAKWQDYQEQMTWTLAKGNGPKHVYVYFKNQTSTSPLMAQVIELTEQDEVPWSFFLTLIAALLGIGGLMWGGGRRE